MTSKLGTELLGPRLQPPQSRVWLLAHVIRHSRSPSRLTHGQGPRQFLTLSPAGNFLVCSRRIVTPRRPYCTVSRRITVVACSVKSPKYIGVGNQLTRLNGTLTVTVTGSPYPAEDGGFGETAMVAP